MWRPSSITVLMVLLMLQCTILLGNGLYLPVPVPPRGFIKLCSTLSEFMEVMDSISSTENGLLISFVTFSVQEDPYISLHIGWIMEFFETSKLVPYFVIMDAPVFLDVNQQVANLPRTSVESLSMLPAIPYEGGSCTLSFDPQSIEGPHQVVNTKTATYCFFQQMTRIPINKWIHLSIQHGQSRFTIQDLEHLQQYEGKHRLPNVILHLNHERPWHPWIGEEGRSAKVTTTSKNKQATEDIHDTFDTFEEMKTAYSRYSLVIRTMYYRKLNEWDNVLTLPLGPSNYNFILNDPTQIYHTMKPVQAINEENKDGVLKVSLRQAVERKLFCYFAGRTSYRKPNLKTNDTDVLLDNNGNSRNLGKLENNDEVEEEELTPEQRGREDLMQLYHKLRNEGGVDTMKNSVDRDLEGEIATHGLVGCFDKFERSSTAKIATDSPDYAASLQANYINYLRNMSSVVFALSPPGTNPESFRFYEALELGAIPLLLVTDIDKDVLQSWSFRANPISPSQKEEYGNISINYLLPDNKDTVLEKLDMLDFEDRMFLEKWWSNLRGEEAVFKYPGPIFNTWTECHQYLVHVERMRLNEKKNEHLQRALAVYLNSLQAAVYYWYRQLFLQTKIAVGNKVDAVFAQ